MHDKENQILSGFVQCQMHRTVDSLEKMGYNIG